MSDGRTYLLVTDEDPESDEDGDAYILRDDTPEDAAEALYTMVDEDEEFERVGGIFQTLLDEEDIDLYPTEDEDLRAEKRVIAARHLTAAPRFRSYRSAVWNRSA